MLRRLVCHLSPAGLSWHQCHLLVGLAYASHEISVCPMRRLCLSLIEVGQGASGRQNLLVMVLATALAATGGGGRGAAGDGYELQICFGDVSEPAACGFTVRLVQDSSKWGAVEAGCSGLHYIIGCLII